MRPDGLKSEVKCTVMSLCLSVNEKEAVVLAELGPFQGVANLQTNAVVFFFNFNSFTENLHNRR